MTKTAAVKLSAAIGINGELIRAGTVITIPEQAAKDLLRRGKAELATAADEPQAEPEAEDEDGDEGEGEKEPEPEPAAKPAKAKK